MMDIAKSETFTNFIILNKALLFLIKLSKTAGQSVLNRCSVLSKVFHVTLYRKLFLNRLKIKLYNRIR